MGFPNKGENHKIGIKNEKNFVNTMNSQPNNIIIQELEKKNNSKIKSFKHEGGTHQRRDASYSLENGTDKGVSIKNHKKGTFDYTNTTKNIPQDLKSEINEFKNKNLDTPISKKGGPRDEMNNILSNYLNNMSSSDITNLLNSFYRIEENTDTIIINDTKNKRLVMMDESVLDEYCNPIHRHNFILKKARAKTSRQIWIKKNDGSEINTNMRIRLILNNGITALLGKSKSNTSSVPCFKIQQDNVDLFISKCKDKVILKY